MSSRSGPKRCDLLVRNAYLITVDAERRVIPHGAVAITGRRIVAVGRARDVLEAYRGERVLDARGGVVHPGFVEAHNHITQHSSRGALSVFHAAEPPLRYAQWKAALYPEAERASSALGCLEMLRAGYTAFVEPGTAFAPDAVADAAQALGMRGWVTDPYLWDRAETLELYPTLISPALLERVPCQLERCLRELGTQLARNRDPDALVRGHVALYGESTASDELQRAAKACARDNGVTFTQHVGFAVEIANAEEARLGKTQVMHMAELGIFDDRTTLVHMNVIKDGDVETLVNAAPSIVWCPANYLAVAAPSGARSRLPGLWRRGVNVGLGVDTAGNCAIGDTAAIAYIAARQAGEIVTGEDLIEMQTIGAARTVGAEKEIGSLSPGKRADLVVRDPDAAEALGFDPVFELALFSRAHAVSTVIVDGQVVLRDGRSTRVDERWVVEEARASMGRIADRLGLARGGRWPSPI